MPKFAEYQPGGRHPVWTGPVRQAGADDLDRVVALSIARDGGDPDARRRRFARRIDADDSALFVADGDGVVGYGLIVTLTFEAGTAPDGLYLGGVVVDPQWRRQGIADALTTARLDWAWPRADAVWYCANEHNRASIDLHRRHGFVEHTREFELPGVTFDGGAGVLFRLDRPAGE